MTHRQPGAANGSVDAVIRDAPDAVVAIDAAGRISRWNRRAEELFGWSAEEALGLPVEEVIIPPAAREAHVAGFRRALSGTEPLRLVGNLVEVHALRRDGAELPIELTVSQVHAEDVAFVAFLRDISDRHAAEAQLREAREMFQLAFKEAPIGIALIAVEDYAWVEVNPALCAMLGYTEAELRAERLPALTFPEDHDEARERSARLLRGESATFRTEKRYRHRDGRVVWADLSVSLLRTGDGRPRFYLAQFLDITERKAADEARRASEQRLADAQAVGHVGSWEWDVEAERITWSDELHHIFGIPLDATPKSPDEFMTFVHPDDLEQVKAAVGTLTGGTDYRIVRPDGEVRWVNGRRALVSRPGEPRRITGTIHDVTDRKRVEHELRRSNAELEQYAHAASHDLASPLTTIGGFASLLRMRYGDQLPEDAGKWIEAIVRGTERMRAMLDAMLAYSRVQHGERTPEPVDLARVVEEVLADLEAPIGERGARVDVGALPTVTGEPALLRQVLLNLLANALKFAAPGEPPQVRVAAERSDAGWTIAVADRGIGMRSEDAEKAFELFTRLASAAEYPGTGMGLALCRKIVERHGGRIWIASAPGAGTTVRFTLPE